MERRTTAKGASFSSLLRLPVQEHLLPTGDIVAVREFPSSMREDLEAYAGCVSGAAPVSEIVRMLNESGFENVTIDKRPGTGGPDFVASALIQGRKPAERPEAVLNLNAPNVADH